MFERGDIVTFNESQQFLGPRHYWRVVDISPNDTLCILVSPYKMESDVWLGNSWIRRATEEELVEVAVELF